MTARYTEIAENSIQNHASLNQYADTLKQLNHPGLFRPFNEGLTELLFKSEYNGAEDNNAAKTNYLYSNLQKTGSNITFKTVMSWFTGKHRPKIEPSSRPKMYEICFSLNLSLEDTQWFFHHVYCDRCFNCHTVEEAVYYFCFKNHLPYADARNLIKEILDFPCLEPPLTADINNYTQFLSKNISLLNQTEDFLKFMKEYRSTFDNWNKSAFVTINNLLAELTGSKQMTAQDIDKTIKRPLMRKINSTSDRRHLDDIDASLFENCGLLLKEIYYDATHSEQAALSAAEYITQIVSGKNVLLNSFVIEQMTTGTTGIPKEKNIPYIVKLNFPSKKSLSDVLSQTADGRNKIETSKNYDMIRKLLVLLHFFTFWIKIKINASISKEYDHEQLYNIYRDEADDCLMECCYEPLFAGNPYDWLFLVSAKSEDPVAFFRCCISDILEE